MVNSIGQGGGNALERNAIFAALQRHAQAEKQMQTAASELSGGEATGMQPEKTGTDFSKIVNDGIQAVNDELVSAEKLPSDLLSGKVNSFDEVAVQIKQADLSFKFAMEIRNKLVDAYREVMRMHV